MKQFTRKLNVVYNRGGGNILLPQRLSPGGNALNLARGLSALGARTKAIVATNKLGQEFLRQSGLTKLALIKPVGELSITTSIELRRGDSTANIMISDSGSVRDFGPEKLRANDWRTILASKWVCVVNWAQNRKGTLLAREVFEKSKDANCRTFFDPGDLTLRPGRVKGLVTQALRKGILDVLSLNLSELVLLGSKMGHRLRAHHGPKRILDLLRTVSLATGVTVDMHSTRFSASSDGSEVWQSPCLRVTPSVATGAGDIWNATDIAGYELGLADVNRLLLANLVAGFYVSKGLPPSISDALKFAKRIVRTA